MYVQRGARERLRRAERQRFLKQEWPAIVARLRRLGIAANELEWEV
jgi:GntR family transcriptional regulator